jgi:hypothetical protein
MAKKPMKSNTPPQGDSAADKATEPTAKPAPRTKKVREVPLSAKEQSRAAKKAARARWMLKNP